MVQSLKNVANARRSARRHFMQRSTDTHSHDPSLEAEVGAYNRAFSELGLEWHWDAGTYRQLQSTGGDKHCVHAYIEANHPHLLQAYDGVSLAAAIDHVRRRLSESVPH
jgi:hypothetical protein